MEEKVIELVKRLTKLNKTIATMESCTGGGFVIKLQVFQELVRF